MFRNPHTAELIKAEENFLIDAQFLVHDLMLEMNMSRRELARAIGWSEARLSQFMSSEANPTLKTVARVLFALGEKPALCTSNVGRQNILDSWTNVDSAMLDKASLKSRAQSHKKMIFARAVQSRLASNDNGLGPSAIEPMELTKAA